MARGELACCDAYPNGTLGSIPSDEDFPRFQVESLGSTDGLLLTEVSVRDSTRWRFAIGEFDHTDVKLSCRGCGDNWRNCSACWIDGDGHGKCDRIRITKKEGDDQTKCLHVNESPSSDPMKLCVKAADEPHAGTNDDVSLTFFKRGHLSF